MPLGWKVLLSHGHRIISNHRRYNPLTDRHRDTYWTPGEWNTVDEVIEPCRNGLHMSPTPAEAWAYVLGDILALVEGAGTSVNSSDTNNYAKSAHSQMRIIRAVALPSNVRRGVPLQDLHKTDAYLRQVFKELPAIKLVQQ